jgi:ATP-binding protein involved in chromosome partitioning
MSFFVCPDTGKQFDIFGAGGGARVAAEYGLPLLAQIPIDPAIREGGDAGRPAVEVEGSPARDAFLALADRVDQLAAEPTA